MTNEPIDAPLHPKSSGDARMAEGSEIMKEYHVNSWDSTWKEPVESFVDKFNSLNPDERSKFVHNIPNLVAKALENKKIHFHESEGHLKRLGQDKVWKKNSLEDLFQLIIEFNQRKTESYVAWDLVSYMNTDALPLFKLSLYSRLTRGLEDLGSKLRSTTFYFRAFLSTETLQVWLLLSEEGWRVTFIRNDFQLEFRRGEGMDNEKSKYRVGNDDFHYLEEQEIDFHQMLKKIKKQEKLLVFHVRIFLDQLVRLEESQQRTENISVPNIGSDLPVKNYLFQLRNPPRMDCRHYKKGCIRRYWPRIGESEEMGMPYYSCSSKESLQYLTEWFDFCSEYLKDNLHLSPSVEGKITAKSFIFIQCRCDNQYYTLLDHPNNYEDHELIYYLDGWRGLHKMESSKIRNFLDEMAPERRQYAVITKREIFVIDQEGNQLPSPLWK